MNRSLIALALIAAFPAAAAAQGPIGTVPRGSYVCEMPGDAAGQAGIPQPDRSFKVKTSSRYATPRGGGLYLRRGDRLDMTTGPLKGETYLVIHPGFLRERLPDGKPGRLRCVLRG
jgi:hypothetical protein